MTLTLLGSSYLPTWISSVARSGISCLWTKNNTTATASIICGHENILFGFWWCVFSVSSERTEIYIQLKKKKLPLIEFNYLIRKSLYVWMYVFYFSDASLVQKTLPKRTLLLYFLIITGLCCWFHKEECICFKNFTYFMSKSMFLRKRDVEGVRFWIFFSEKYLQVKMPKFKKKL